MLTRLLTLVGSRRRAIGALALSSVLSGLIEAGILAIVAQVATVLAADAPGTHESIGPFSVDTTTGTLLAIALILTAMRIALQVPISFLPARIAANVQAQLRKDLFAAFTHSSWATQSRDHEGHLQEMLTSQVVQATLGALQMAALISAAFTFLVLIASAMVLNVLAAIVVLGVAGLLFVLLRPLNALGHRRSHSLSQAQMNYAGGVGEAVRLAEEVRVFGVAEPQRISIERLVETARALFFRTQLLARLIPNLYQSLIYIIVVAGLGGLYAAGAGHVASLGAVVLLLLRAGTYGQQIQGSYQTVRQALPFVERLQDAERTYSANRPPSGHRRLERIDGLAFQDVSFAYSPGQPVLSNITFEIPAGEAVGIVGPSGAGKSTLVQLLLRLREPSGGRYLVNGVPARELNSADWHSRVTYVPQKPCLLHASVADNIRFFRNLDDAAVQRAAQLAGIHNEIMSWSDGYNTLIGPRANAVSGGQQQRICLARALGAHPTVLVLDEPTSALDPHSELLIQESLASLKHQMTIFVVAHRMTTLELCERVMVVVSGHLQAFDAVPSLRKSNTYYRSSFDLAAGVFGDAAP